MQFNVEKLQFWEKIEPKMYLYVNDTPLSSDVEQFRFVVADQKIRLKQNQTKPKTVELKNTLLLTLLY